MVAGKLKESALGTGQKLVRLVKLLVLAFWVGGGAVAGAIVPFSMQRKFPSPEAADIVGAILTWFSWSQIGLGAIALALMLWIDRARRVSIGAFIVLLLLVGGNFFVIHPLMRAQSPASWAHHAYIVIFCGGWLVALVHFLLTAASSAEYRPLPAARERPAPAEPAPPAGRQPPAALRSPARGAQGPPVETGDNSNE